MKQAALIGLVTAGFLSTQAQSAPPHAKIGAIVSICVWHKNRQPDCDEKFIPIQVKSESLCERVMSQEVINGVFKTYFLADGSKVTPAYEGCTYQEAR